MHSQPRVPHFVLALAACALAASGIARAADTNRHDAATKLRNRFEAADSNHDGWLDRAEAARGMPHIAAHFDAVDADHDGRLSQAEVAAYLVQARAARK